MLETMREDLKLQQELFISFTLDRLAPPPVPTRTGSSDNKKTITSSTNTPSPAAGTPVISNATEEVASETSSMPSTRPTALPAKGETRELLLQTLNHLCRSASFMVDLYVNYDCDINCENLLERLITFATKVYSYLELICTILIHQFRASIPVTTQGDLNITNNHRKHCAWI
jgi:golgi-specific brefeldin A-resistance guanine nucleotide exchange factor 1